MVSKNKFINKRRKELERISKCDRGIRKEIILAAKRRLERLEMKVRNGKSMGGKEVKNEATCYDCWLQEDKRTAANHF
jgi:hypothetical protein